MINIKMNSCFARPYRHGHFQGDFCLRHGNIEFEMYWGHLIQKDKILIVVVSIKQFSF
jgi:hypothetical protein